MVYLINTMKVKLVVLAVLVSFKTFAQFYEPEKKYSIGVGYTWAIHGIGGNINFGYALTNRINVRLTATSVIHNKQIYFQETPTHYILRLKPEITSANALSVNYFLAGNADVSSPFGLYVGAGLGYLYNSTKYYNYISKDTSYNEKYIYQGLSVSANVGLTCKIGPGKLFAEMFYTQILAGTFKMIGSNPNPTTLHLYPYKENIGFINDGYATLGFNVGYAFYF